MLFNCYYMQANQETCLAVQQVNGEQGEQRGERSTCGQKLSENGPDSIFTISMAAAAWLEDRKEERTTWTVL